MLSIVAFVVAVMNIRTYLGRLSGIRFLGRLLCAVLPVVMLSTYSPPVSSAEETRNVLLFFSEDASVPAIAIINRSIRSTLARGTQGRIHLYSEYLDQQRLPDERYRRLLVSYLSLKYAGQKMDLVIAVGAPALVVMQERGANLFPQTPTVFFALDKRDLEGLNLDPNVTGVTGSLELSPTLDLALKLHPDTRRVVVVTGASSLDKFWESKVREEFRSYESKVQIVYLAGMKMVDLQKEIANLSEHAIIFYSSMMLDGKGDFYTSPEALSLIAKASNAPIYGISPTYLGQGMVGGYLPDFEALGSHTARFGLRVLAGEKPREIKIESLPSTPMFDWRQLRRWGVSEKSLPPGSVVRFEPPSFWDLYKWRIIGGIALIIVQTLLISALLINRSMRRRAQHLLAERLRFETLLAELSAAFVSLPADEVDREIEKWLQRPIESLDVDRISLMEYSPDATMVGVAHSSTRPGVEPVSDLVLITHSPWYAEQLRRGKPLAFSRLPDDLPEEAKLERDYCFKTGLKSNVIIPLPVAGDRNCALAFGSSHSYRDWPDELVARLQLIGEVFANALARKQGEQSLLHAFAEIKELKDQLQAENTYLQEEIKLSHNFNEIIGNSDELKYVLYKVEQVAAADTTVLILGETGTGKELIARAIHHASPRKNRTLVKVNCAALPANLIESELFGHEKGAFTGASARHHGRFELANGGTLFLDEIGELPLELQSKLLRVLEEGEFERVGGSQTLKVDVRVIAATNRNLKAEVQAGLFREDLWYRLNIFPVTLPPLRQRKSDIPLLVNHFVNQFSKKLGKPIQTIAPGTMKELQEYAWPGNVRELANVIEREVINVQGPVLHLADKLDPVHAAHPSPNGGNGGKSLAEMEREIILQRLEATGWKIEGPHGAAKSLGLNPSTLRLRMDKLGIQRPEVRN